MDRKQDRFRARFFLSAGGINPRVGVTIKLHPLDRGYSEMSVNLTVSDGLEFYRAIGRSLRQAAKDGFLDPVELLNETGKMEAGHATVSGFQRNREPVDNAMRFPAGLNPPED